jgi:hypothetical protein
MVTADAPGRVKPRESFIVYARTSSSRPATSSRIRPWRRSRSLGRPGPSPSAGGGRQGPSCAPWSLRADERHRRNGRGCVPQFVHGIQARRRSTTPGVYYLRIRLPEDGRPCPFVLADHLRTSDPRSNGSRAPIATGAPFASVWSPTITCSCAVTTAASRSRCPSADGSHGS